MKSSQEKVSHKRKLRNLSSQTRVSGNKSQKSLSPHQFKPCTSHLFSMKPCINNASPYYRENVQFHYCHEDPECRPYPVFLEEFKETQYIPLFGLQAQVQKFKTNSHIYKEHFNQEKLKLVGLSAKKKSNALPIPKHTYCQVCKTEFQNYDKHINEAKHLKNLKESQGNLYLEQCIEDYQSFIDQLNQKQELQPLDRLLQCLADLNPLVNKRFDYYLSQKTKLHQKLQHK